jgi:hypothetical protein
VVERWVDGQASRQKLRSAHQSAWKEWGTPARTAVADASAVEWDVGHAVNAARHAAWADSSGTRADELTAQTVLLRCIVGSPFRALPTIGLAWLTWNAGIVQRLAEEVYEQRELPPGTFDVDRLAILGDALEDAGCGDPALVDHLRGPGPHVRGCWVIDVLTNRE